MAAFIEPMAQHIFWQNHVIDKAFRANIKRQRPCLLWFTGLSGSGKSTISGLVEQRLASMGLHTYLLDSDNVRHGLCRDLGFGTIDRVENIRRLGEVGKLMVDAGLVVLAAFISPFRSDREQARALFPSGEFIEIFVDTPLEECERRDLKGLYKKARAGEIPHFTGFDSPYETPLSANLHLQTIFHSATECTEQVIDYLSHNGFLPSASARQ
jgi:adenylyl-sulfate kinase